MRRPFYKMVYRMKFSPRPYQEIIVNHILSTPRCNVWVPMGCGKSASVLKALITDNEWPVLIVAPLRVAQSTWPDEIAKWDEFKHLKIVPILGTVGQRENALREKADIYTINYENVEWLITRLRGRWPFKAIVADESTKLKGFRTRQGTRRARALALVAHDQNVKRFINLTGTPSPNGIADLWGQNWFIDRGLRLGNSFSAFSQRWFRPDYSGFGIIPHDHSQKEVEGKLKDITVSINTADYFDLQKPVVNNIYVSLPAKVTILYKEMEKEMYIQLGQHDVQAFNAASRTMKCLQLASGAVYVGEDAEAWEEVHDEKIRALESIIDEAAGAPVLVAYHFRSDLDRLVKAFPKGKALDKNPQTIKDWNAGKIPVLFAHPASAGHGINLQDGGNIIAFFSHNWNLEEYQQIIERIGPVRQMQSGHKRPVFIHHIIAKNTVDEIVMARRETKREVQDLLLEAMKYERILPN